MEHEWGLATIMTTHGELRWNFFGGRGTRRHVSRHGRGGIGASQLARDPILDRVSPALFTRRLDSRPEARGDAVLFEFVFEKTWWFSSTVAANPSKPQETGVKRSWVLWDAFSIPFDGRARQIC
jgi:hypothetical protein